MEAKVRTLLQKATKKNPFESLTGGEDTSDDYRKWDPSGVAVAAAERERRSLATHPIPLTALQEDDVLTQLEQVYYNSGIYHYLHTHVGHDHTFRLWCELVWRAMRILSILAPYSLL